MRFAGNKSNKQQHQISFDIEHAKHVGSSTSMQVHEKKEKDVMSVGSATSSARNFVRAHSTMIVISLVLVMGIATSAGFLATGLYNNNAKERIRFDRLAGDVTNKISAAFEDYVFAASMVHTRCRHRDFTRADFRELYEALFESGLRFKAVQFDPNITRDEREGAEAEARAYYAKHYPHVEYQGIRGFNTLNSTTLEPRTEQDFYFPIHYMEPIKGNEAAIDLDYYSSESRIRAVKALFQHKQPSLTDRLSLVKKKGSVSRCGNHNGPSYGVVLMHPGVQLTTPSDSEEIWPRDFSSIVLCVPDLLRRSTERQSEDVVVYIHDMSHPGKDPVFLGGVRVDNYQNNDSESVAANLSFLDEVQLENINKGRLYQETQVTAANRIWTITVVDADNTSLASNNIFVIISTILILLASACIAVWVWHSSRRAARFNAMRADAEAEKASLILDNARQATRAERELNDFIAHEVRNPVAAAMAATSFVKIAVNKSEPLQDEESRQTTRDDIDIIDKALRFVNDLLRNMLDMHRAASKQLQVTMAPTDLLHDVVEPVGGMLHQRGSKIKLIVDCPSDIIIMTDCLRLKQVLLNLGRNSSKFIDEGFIRLKAEIVNGTVRLYVDDSGCGIPKEKRNRLFAKFQESLDLLSQGTGIGLHLCKNLVELMGGDIYLDDDYHSGIEGHPGTRFVVDLKVAPIEQPQSALEYGGSSHGVNFVKCTDDDNGRHSAVTGETEQFDDTSSQQMPAELPDDLNVLFVDDDPILRKLFTRSVKRVVPTWSVREASNGETALQLTDENQFDVIFIDMYMASVEKQLLGTETVEALRGKGVQSRICGLSANDKESEFIEAGADAFMFKPFPCDADALTQMLRQILYQDPKDHDPNVASEFLFVS